MPTFDVNAVDNKETMGPCNHLDQMFRIVLRFPPKYLMGPYPRYLLDRCCDNTKHITNLDDNDCISYLIGSCKDTTRAVREFCFTIGVRKIRILNPLIMMIGDEESTDELDWEALWMLWGEDPVHPYTSAY
jgi:hypothetical protein